MIMNENISEILGKTISAIIIREHDKPGLYNSQLFLLFDDNSSYEFYSDCAISPCGTLNRRQYTENILSSPDEDMRVVYQAQRKNAGQ